MLPRTLTSKIQQLGLIPTLVFIILISGGLLGLYNDRLTQLESDYGNIGLNWLAQEARLGLQNNNHTHSLQEVVDNLIEGLNIESAQIYDAERQIIASSGPKLKLNLTEHLTNTSAKFTLQPHILLSSIPIYSDTKQLLGWAVLGFNQHISSNAEHLGIIIAMACIILAFVILMTLATRLNKDLHQPLQQLLSTLEAYNNGRFSSRTPVEGCQELQHLAKEMNQLGSQLQSSKLEVQQQINQATDDLHETLEALEVQNVQLDMARKNALQASRVKSEFLANTSHEIRTPINGIIGFTSLLLKTQLTKQQREYLRTIANSSQGLLTIINDILDFSRIESGKLTLDHTPLDLRELVEETLQILAPIANDKQQQLICLIDHKMPLEMIGDSLRLKQILSNLVSNAIKFSGRGNVIIRVSCKEQKSNRAQIKISVSDSGIGIPQDQQKLIFEAFSQLDTANSREQGGTGLGLAISKGLVERMDGSIGVESELGKGATFWFTANLRITESQPDQGLYQELADKVIGLLDVNAISRLQMEHYLEGWNVQVQSIDTDTEIPHLLKSCEETGTPLEALIVCTDFEGDEYRAEYLRHLVDLAKAHWHIPVILIAQPETVYDQHQGLLDSVAETLAKPITHDRLYQTLCEHIGIQTSISKKVAISTHPPQLDRKPNILAVDDNPANLQLVTEFLLSLGTNVIQASSGREALEHCAKQQFDLIFMDIQMPVLDGLATTKQLREMEPPGQRTPVIALTAYAMNEQKSELLLAGLDDYTTKPVSESQLAHLLNRWIEPNSQLFQPSTIRSAVLPPETGEATKTHEPRSVFDIMDLSESLRLANYKPRLAKEMLVMLLNELSENSQKLKAFYADKDWENLEHCVHQLHGGCCYCGVPQLRNASGLLDKLLQKGYHNQIEEPFEGLIAAINTLQEWEQQHDIDSLFDDSNQDDEK